VTRATAEGAASYNLDFLRACAVLFVFAGHLLQTLHIETVFGSVTIYDVAQTGVLIFFVHTSLVLMLSLERQEREGGGRLFASFYIRRAFRIYPLAIAVVMVMVLGRIPPFPTAAYAPWTWTTIVSNLALIQNLTNEPSLYAPLWSLPYEVQMYVVLPFLFVYLRKHWQQEWIARSLWLMAAVAITAAAMTRIPAISILYYVPCFLAGLVSYRRWSSSRVRLPFAVWPLAIVACVLLPSVAGAWAGPGALLPMGWVACLALGLVLPAIRELRAGWIQIAVSTIAKYSYGIYMSHGIALWLSLVVLKGEPLVVRIGMLMAGSVILPLLCYHLVEGPMMRMGGRIARSVSETPQPVERSAAA
jgi:peptidoglycan/LPS O-acetylase OafA/YrhL